MADEKREEEEEEKEAEGRTYNSAVITCTVSYSPWGDTRSISIQRISCRVVLRRSRGRIAVVVVLVHVKVSRTGTSTLRHVHVAGSEYIPHFPCIFMHFETR